VIAGDGPYKIRIEEIIERHFLQGRVILKGMVPHKVKWEIYIIKIDPEISWPWIRPSDIRCRDWEFWNLDVKFHQQFSGQISDLW